MGEICHHPSIQHCKQKPEVAKAYFPSINIISVNLFSFLWFLKQPTASACWCALTHQPINVYLVPPGPGALLGTHGERQE